MEAVISPTSLILLSYHFPYSTGESFLEDELPYLCKSFDEVYLLPLYTTKNQRSIDSQKIKLIKPPKFHKSVVLDLVRGFFTNPKLLIEEFLSLNTKQKLNPFVWYRLIRTAGIAKRVVRQISEVINEYSLKNPVLYSYWLKQSALASVFLENIEAITVARAHSGDLYSERALFGYLPWQKKIVAHLDRIATISSHGTSYLTHQYDSVLNKVRIFRLGVPSIPEGTSTLEEKNMIRLLSCSSVIPLKRVEKIFETAWYLAKLKPDSKVIWTHFGNGSEFENLLQRTHNQKFPNLEVDLRGYRSHEDIVRFYESHKVEFFLNYSTNEGIPVSIMEALSAGVPVVAPAVNGIPEIVDESCGFLFDVNEKPEIVASKINELLKAEDGAKLRENAHQKWANEYDADKNYTAFALWLSELSKKK